jgi:hypothetical protein
MLSSERLGGQERFSALPTKAICLLLFTPQLGAGTEVAKRGRL